MQTSDGPGLVRRMIRRALPLFLLAPLAACLGAEGEGEGLGFLTGPAVSAGKPALTKTSLYRGDVVVSGPRGYCIDSDSLRRGSAGSFVLLASCESISGQRGANAAAPAVMTVSVLPRQGPDAQPTAAELAAPLAPARVIRSENGDGISLVYLSKGGEVVMPGGNPAYWRAAMSINGHLVGLAVYLPNKGQNQQARGYAMILALAETLRENSPVRDYSF